MLQLAFIAAHAVVTIRIERKHHGTLERREPVASSKAVFHRLLFGRSPILWGYICVGDSQHHHVTCGRAAMGQHLGLHPVGRKIADAAGFDVEAWAF